MSRVWMFLVAAATLWGVVIGLVGLLVSTSEWTLVAASIIGGIIIRLVGMRFAAGRWL